MNLFELAATLMLDSSDYDKGIDEAQGKAASFGSKVKSGFSSAAKVGAAAIGAASAAAVAFAKSSVDAGMTFDSSMSQVAATMGTTVDEIQDLRDFAQEMGSKTAFSASQAADALNYMALAGYDAETSMEMLPNVLNLAAAGGIDLAYASDMITDSQSALGLSLDETAELVDKMAKASSKSNTSVAQLGEAILTVGGTAKTLAGGTTELSTALGILADNGVKGAEGGTALRNIILSLSAPTSTAAEAMESLGLNAFDADGNLRPLEDTFGDLNEALSSMSQGEQTQALNKIFNKVDLKSVNALLATSSDRWYELSDAIDHSYANATSAIQNADIDWSKYLSEPWIKTKETMGDAWKSLGDQIKYNLKDQELSVQETAEFISSEYNMSMEDALKAVGAVSNEFETVTGAAQAMADTQLDNLAGDITLFQSALEGAQIVLSDQLTPTLRKFVKFGEDGISSITDAFKEGGLSGAMEAFGGILSDGIAMITEMLPTVIEAGASLIFALVEGITDNIPTMLTAAVDIISTIGDKIVKKLPTLIEKIGSAFSTLISNFFQGGQIEKLLETGTAIVKMLAEEIAKAIPDIIWVATDFITSFVETVLESLPELLSLGSTIIQQLAEGISNGIALLGENIPWIIEYIISVFNTEMPKIIESGKGILTALIDGIKLLIPQLTEAIPQIIQAVVDLLIQAVPQLIDAGIQLFTALVEALPTVIEQISAAIPQLITGIINALKNLLPKLIESGKSIITALKDGFVKSFPAIVGLIPTLIKELVGIIKELLPEIIKAGIELFTALVEALPEIIQAIVEVIPDIISAVITAVIELIPLIIQAGIDLFVALVQALPDIITAIVAAIPKIITGVITAIMGAIPQLIQAGITLFVSLVKALPEIIVAVTAAIPQIITGLVDAIIDSLPQMIEAGITLFISLIEALPQIITALIEAVPQIINAFREAFGLEGKSFSEIGKNMIMGIWDGIKNMAEWLKEKVSGFFNGIVDTVKDTLGIQSPSKVFAQIGKYSAQGIGVGFDNEFDTIRKDIDDQMDFTATANVSVNKKSRVTDTYSASGGYVNTIDDARQPLVVILQLPSGVEVGRQYIEDINLAKRVDGMTY